MFRMFSWLPKKFRIPATIDDSHVFQNSLTFSKRETFHFCQNFLEYSKNSKHQFLSTPVTLQDLPDSRVFYWIFQNILRRFRNVKHSTSRNIDFRFFHLETECTSLGSFLMQVRTHMTPQCSNPPQLNCNRIMQLRFPYIASLHPHNSPMFTSTPVKLFHSQWGNVHYLPAGPQVCELRGRKNWTYTNKHNTVR